MMDALNFILTFGNYNVLLMLTVMSGIMCFILFAMYILASCDNIKCLYGSILAFIIGLVCIIFYIIG